MDLFVQGKRVRITPAQSIGKGGEADIYRTGPDVVLKLFKTPDHPDLHGLPEEQAAAARRLDLHQKKLPALQALKDRLPSRAITPVDLATDRGGSRIAGYTMPFLDATEVLLRYGEGAFRSAGVSQESVRRILLDLHEVVSATHRAGVVIGDFNDLNVLVRGLEVYLIDTDSFQFGPFPCPVFTARFVDPLLCMAGAEGLNLCRPHNEASDWYAYAVMVMQCLLLVGPYGGVYRPRQAADLVPHDARPLHRITVFHPEVRYPRPAIPFDRLSDDLLHHLQQVFVKDRRGQFPRRLLDDLCWTTCPACGTEHARSSCPACRQAVPVVAPPPVQVRGKISVRRIFRTDGLIVHAAVEGGELRWLWYEDGQVRREDGSVVSEGPLQTQQRFRIRGPRTCVGIHGQVRIVSPRGPGEVLAVDNQGQLPVFDTNERHLYWAAGGRLWRDGTLGPEPIGEVLAGQTQFWVGPEFGFGFYRAGGLSVAFVFDAERKGIRDDIRLPPLQGQLVQADCCLTSERCWFLAALHHGGRVIHQAALIRRDGSVEASVQAAAGDGSWLGTVPGKCAVGPFLFAPTDEGIVRVEAGQILKVREFPDTQPFVDAGCRLFVGREGLFVVDRQEIRLLQMG